MGKRKDGTVDSWQTVKAGCGIRFDPEVLGDDCGFDFSNAEKLKPQAGDENEEEVKPDENTKNP